jgi:hypothetical protein
VVGEGGKGSLIRGGEERDGRRGRGEKTGCIHLPRLEIETFDPVTGIVPFLVSEQTLNA